MSPRFDLINNNDKLVGRVLSCPSTHPHERALVQDVLEGLRDLRSRLLPVRFVAGLSLSDFDRRTDRFDDSFILK